MPYYFSNFAEIQQQPTSYAAKDAEEVWLCYIETFLRNWWYVVVWKLSDKCVWNLIPKKNHQEGTSSPGRLYCLYHIFGEFYKTMRS